MYLSSRSRAVSGLEIGFGSCGELVTQCNRFSYISSRRHFGGEIPSFIEISCPVINTRLKVDIPREDIVSDETSKSFSPKRLIQLARRAMLSSRAISTLVSRQWKYHVERSLRAGRSLALAWRLGAQLDWVWQEEDAEGEFRGWAVLLGLSLHQVFLSIVSFCGVLDLCREKTHPILKSVSPIIIQASFIYGTEQD